MKRSKIRVQCLVKEGFNEIGDRDIELDEHRYYEADTEEEAQQIAEQKDLHGEGLIQFFSWNPEFRKWDFKGSCKPHEIATA